MAEKEKKKENKQIYDKRQQNFSNKRRQQKLQQQISEKKLQTIDFDIEEQILFIIPLFVNEFNNLLCNIDRLVPCPLTFCIYFMSLCSKGKKYHR